MPNHCYTDLLVEGPQRDVAAFVACARGKDEALSFERLVPMPPSLVDDDVAEKLNTRVGKVNDTSGLPSWLSWALSHWGTKWDCWDVSFDENMLVVDGRWSVEYGLTTAWSPPFDFFATVLRDLFPTLRFTMRYTDEARNFGGWTVLAVLDGRVVGTQARVEPPSYEDDDGWTHRDIEIGDGKVVAVTDLPSWVASNEPEAIATTLSRAFKEETRD